MTTKKVLQHRFWVTSTCHFSAANQSLFLLISFSLSIYLYLYLWLLLWLNSSLKFKRFGWIMNTVLLFLFRAAVNFEFSPSVYLTFHRWHISLTFWSGYYASQCLWGQLNKTNLLRTRKKSKFEARNETKKMKCDFCIFTAAENERKID